MIHYKLNGAQALLKDVGGAPVLTFNNTKTAKTAFFTLPPTFVKRSKSPFVYGQRSNSILVNKATAAVQKMLSRALVTTTAGTLIAFEDQDNVVHIIISENSCPLRGGEIRPLVTINIPGISAEDISSDKSLEIVKLTNQSVFLRLVLKEYESIRITVRKNLRHIGGLPSLQQKF